MSDSKHNHAPVLAGTATPSRLSADLAALRACSAGQSPILDGLEKAHKSRGFAMFLLIMACISGRIGVGKMPANFTGAAGLATERATTR